MNIDALYPQLGDMEIQASQLILNQEHESDFLFNPVQAEPEMTVAMESLERESDIPVGTIIPSVDAVGWHEKGLRNVDIRP